MTSETPTTTATAAPSTVTVAYWLHMAGAVLGLVGAVVLIAILPGQLDSAQSRLGDALQGQDTGGIDVGGITAGAVIGGVVLNVLMTIAFSVLTFVFAQKFRRGRNWARIVLAVFAGLQIFGVAGAFGTGAVHFLVVLAALILGFLPASNAWFAAMKPVRRTS